MTHASGDGPPHRGARLHFSFQCSVRGGVDRAADIHAHIGGAGALEGLNAQIRDLLRRHRGMTEQHRRRAVEWFLALHELPLEQALDLARPTDSPTPEQPVEEPPGPALYDTGLDPAEGLWHRSGWIGQH